MSEDKFTFESERFIKESLCFFFFTLGVYSPRSSRLCPWLSPPELAGSSSCLPVNANTFLGGRKLKLL